MYPEAPLTGASRTTDHVQAPPSRDLELPLLDQETVEGWVARWQRRLGLREWKIESRIVRLSQLPRGTVANVHWSLPRKSATIKVLDPIDSTLPRSEVVRDTELSVVHELIHLSMAKLPLDSNDTELEEEAVRRISFALMALERGEDAAIAPSKSSRNLR
ncbi:MAG TPA: hypothetical protein VES20_17220 [Bryobacteraceae bacterium]|nr:hypothetical protein [Bryobacteraceae bacterium]